MGDFKKLSLLLLIFLLSFLTANFAGAFGFAPGAVANYELLPGSHFEQEMILLRSDPLEDIRVKAKIETPDFPEVKNWISIDKGTSFVIPKGTYQYPIKVIVDVPQKTKIRVYEGYLDLKTEPVAEEGATGVSIVLGARIHIALGLTDKPFPNFVVRAGEISDVQYGSPIKYIMKVENTGNVKTRPSKVVINIFDSPETRSFLKAVEVGAEDLDWVKPYKTKMVTAKIPVKLELGKYWAETQVYKGDIVIREDKTFFSVNPVKKYLGLTFWTWIWLGIGLAILAAGAKFWIWMAERRRVGSNPEIGEEAPTLNEEILEEKP